MGQVRAGVRNQESEPRVRTGLSGVRQNRSSAESQAATGLETSRHRSSHSSGKTLGAATGLKTQSADPSTLRGSLANQVILLQAKPDSAASPLLLTKEVEPAGPRLSCKP